MKGILFLTTKKKDDDVKTKCKAELAMQKQWPTLEKDLVHQAKITTITYNLFSSTFQVKLANSVEINT